MNKIELNIPVKQETACESAEDVYNFLQKEIKKGNSSFLQRIEDAIKSFNIFMGDLPPVSIDSLLSTYKEPFDEVPPEYLTLLSYLKRNIEINFRVVSSTTEHRLSLEDGTDNVKKTENRAQINIEKTKSAISDFFKAIQGRRIDVDPEVQFIERLTDITVSRFSGNKEGEKNNVLPKQEEPVSQPKFFNPPKSFERFIEVFDLDTLLTLNIYDTESLTDYLKTNELLTDENTQLYEWQVVIRLLQKIFHEIILGSKEIGGTIKTDKTELPKGKVKQVFDWFVNGHVAHEIATVYTKELNEEERKEIADMLENKYGIQISEIGLHESKAAQVRKLIDKSKK